MGVVLGGAAGGAVGAVAEHAERVRSTVSRRYGERVQAEREAAEGQEAMGRNTRYLRAIRMTMSIFSRTPWVETFRAKSSLSLFSPTNATMYLAERYLVLSTSPT